MKHRHCDSCRKEIPTGEKYLKVCESMLEKNVQRLNHVADFCNLCFKEMIKEKKK